jgi:hypothetical protein
MSAPANPVNAAVVTAEVELVARNQIWLRAPDDVIRAWAPAETAGAIKPGSLVELYLAEDGSANGWWDKRSGLAVNQRRLNARSQPTPGEPMACQGACGLVWTAPAASDLAAHEEQCLTCAGTLAHG